MLLLLPVAFARPSATVALTFDDLPYQTRDRRPALEDPAERAAVTEAILAALGRTPAAVFVNCGWLADGEDLAERWGRAGHAVANHTAHHPSVDRAEDWATEVAACDLRLRGVPGFEPWFRYPYLRHGQTAEVRAAAGAALAASGLRNVPPTVPTSEWWLGAAYDRADAPTREALASAYVDHVVESIRLAQDHARARVGHDVPHVVLLHVNRLEADHLGALLSRFEAEDIAVVPVERALRDEVYARPDVYDGGGSVSWLFRLDPTGPPDPEPFGALEGALAQRFRPAHGLRWTWAVPIERQTAFSDEVARRVHALGIDLELEAVDGRLVAEVFSLPSEEELVRAALSGGSTLEWSVALDLPEALRVDDPARGLRVLPGAVSRRGGAEPVTSAAAVQGPADAIAALALSAPEGGRVAIERAGADGTGWWVADAPSAVTPLIGVDRVDERGVRLRFEPSAARALADLTGAAAGQTVVVGANGRALLHLAVREPLGATGKLLLPLGSYREAEALAATVAPWAGWVAPLSVEPF